MDISKLNSNLAWGTTTWWLFHWISQNIDESFFIINRLLIINMLKEILLTIPCPTCNEHAKAYISHYDMKKFINNKNDLKKYFVVFHNIVNRRLNKKIENIQILEQYNNYKGYQILNNWNKYYKNDQGVVMYNFMSKINMNKIRNKVNNFFRLHYSQFDNFE